MWRAVCSSFPALTEAEERFKWHQNLRAAATGVRRPRGSPAPNAGFLFPFAKGSSFCADGETVAVANLASGRHPPDKVARHRQWQPSRNGHRQQLGELEARLVAPHGVHGGAGAPGRAARRTCFTTPRSRTGQRLFVFGTVQHLGPPLRSSRVQTTRPETA